MKQKVMCDDCEKEFTIKKTKKKVYTDGDRGKVYFHYIVCPHCTKKYEYHIESDEINSWIKKRKALYLSTAKMTNLQAGVAIAEMKELESKIKKAQAELKLLAKLALEDDA